MRAIFQKLRHPAVCLLFLASSWLFYAPPRHWPGLTYFGDGQDSLAFIWFLNWWPFALTHHLPLLFTHYADYPAGTDLVWKTSVPALGFLVAPFTLVFGALRVFNVLMIAAPALAAFGMYLAAFEFTGVFAAALAAGVLFGISGYEIGQSLGHLNLAFTLAVPLCLWACLRATARGWSSWHLGLVLGGLFLFEFGVAQEVFASMLFFGAIALLVLFMMNAARRGAVLRLLPGIAIGLGLFLLLASPFLYGMLRSYAAEQQNFSTPEIFSNDLLSFLIPTPLTFLGGHLTLPLTQQFSGNFCEQDGYFGLPLVALTAFICLSRPKPAWRALGVMALLAALAGLGPAMHVLGHEASIAPWAVFAHLPLFKAMLPGRFALYAWVAMALLVAAWLAEPIAGWRRFLAVGLCLLSLVPAQSRDRNWRHFDTPAAFATLPAGAHVLVIPEFGQEMGWQYAGSMRFMLVGQGYLGNGRPAPFNRWALFEPLWENQFAKVDPAALAAYLANYGVQDVVLLPRGYGFFNAAVTDNAGALAAQNLLRAAGWTLAASSPTALLFHPPATPATVADLAMYLPAPPVLTAWQRARRIQRETRWVCDIREATRFTDTSPRLALQIYAARVHPLLETAAIKCK